MLAYAQSPELAYSFKGGNTYANMGEILKDVNTVEFWIKPSADINTSTTIMPVLVRDRDTYGFIGPEEYALYFEGSTGTHPGKLIFRAGDGNTSAEIHSDNNSWSKNRWYHISATIDPNTGLKLIIDGVEQQDKSNEVKQLFFEVEGSSGTLLLGRWDVFENEYLNAQIDELRFWNSSRTVKQTRDNMCQLTPISGSPAKYIDFNVASSSNLVVQGSQMNVKLNFGNTADYINSNAPTGQFSTHLYADDFTNLSLSLNNLFNIKIDSILTTAKGVHLYSFTDPTIQPINNGQFGVWFTEGASKYNVNLDYSSLDNFCDQCAYVESRDTRLNTNWNKRTARNNSCLFEIDNESTMGLPHREEYHIIDTVLLYTGIDDTLIYCSDDTKYASPTDYPGATYTWDDTVNSQSFTFQDTGMHSVKIEYNGCVIEQDFWVRVKETPYFSLPKDTTICQGDTMWINAPVDSASYLWIGLFDQRRFGITSPGVYNLRITKNGCVWEDEIEVKMIKNFYISLGPDTNLCLGQGLNFNFPSNGIDYVWNDGNTDSYRNIFNQPGRYWVTASNQCFSKSDTINVTYEECECRIFVSNSFTPNGDGINDIFHAVTGCFYEEFELDIMNRWGDIMFKSTSLDQGWDGTYNGKDAPIGLYNYRIRYKKYSWHQINSYQYGQIILTR